MVLGDAFLYVETKTYSKQKETSRQNAHQRNARRLLESFIAYWIPLLQQLRLAAGVTSSSWQPCSSRRWIRSNYCSDCTFLFRAYQL